MLSKQFAQLQKDMKEEEPLTSIDDTVVTSGKKPVRKARAKVQAEEEVVKVKGKGKGKQTRNACFTLNNWTADDAKDIRSMKGVTYGVFGEEVAPGTGTPHLQGYLEFKTAKYFTTLHKLCGGRIHWEERKGTAKQASDYCKKEGKVIEWGMMSKQGARKDLVAMQQQIKEGKSIKDLCDEDPNSYHLYGRTLEKIADDILLEKKRNGVKTECVWYFGETGVGKSELAYKGFDEKTHYLWVNDGGWQDGYAHQQVVILDDFRGFVAYEDLLRMTDKWEWRGVRRRGKSPLYFTSSKVIITSSLPPEEVYVRSNKKDSLAQLARRIQVFRVLRGPEGGDPILVSHTINTCDDTHAGLSTRQPNNSGEFKHRPDPGGLSLPTCDTSSQVILGQTPGRCVRGGRMSSLLVLPRVLPTGTTEVERLLAEK